jgi:D-3-phosphoglycerate dehydrogenase / 2-oxoglutarate reductase
MNKKKVLISDRFSQESVLYLQSHPWIEVVKSDSPSHLPMEHLISAHALLIRSRTIIDEALLKKARNLQVIISATSGFDHIDLDATKKWGITVMHTPSANIESAAQLTFGLVLTCASQLLKAHRMVKSGEWDRQLIQGFELSSSHYGIVGLGRIGQRVAQIAKSFNMTVTAYDPYQDDEVFEKLNVQRASFEEILKTSDVVSFHVPRTLETDNMLNRSHFEYMNRNLIIVNTSRGTVIKEADLCEALEKGHLRAVGLDVYEKEPLSRTSKLLQFPNVVLTPHIGANTEEAFYKASKIAATKLISFLSEGLTADTLPPRVPWYGATPFKSE